MVLRPLPANQPASVWALLPQGRISTQVSAQSMAADVKILEGDALRKYILDYQKKYIQKL